MRIKNKLLVLIWCILTIQISQIGLCVTPPRSNFHFIFENTFEDDQLGIYTLGDYNQDWFSPEWNHRRDKCDIIQDANPRYNKYMRGYFPNGIFSVENSGFGWQSPVQEQVTEMYFSYDVRFKPGFEWVLGGKLPGMIGGPLLTTPTGLEATSGYSTRPMWKQDGRIVMYIYHHDMTGEYGDTYNWDLVNNTAFQFQTGQWYNVTLRVVLNSINTSTGKGNNDGILEGWIDGDLRYQRTNYKFRNSENIKFDYLYVTAFFGGGTQDWAATRDEWMDTDNYVAFSYNSNVADVPRGFQASVLSKKLVHPYLDDLTSVVAVTGVAINPTSTSINIGSTTTLTATVLPSNATNKIVAWLSSNPSIASVGTTGIVTGVATGSATITATTQNGNKIATSVITVNSIPVTSVTITPATTSINIGATTSLTATISPINATNKSVTWSSSNSAIAMVNIAGIVSGISAGSVTITATTVEGLKVANAVITISNTSNLLTGLEEYYKFDETSGQAIDSKGVNNSSIVNATQGSPGKIGTCYSFNGTSNKITFVDHTNWTINQTTNLTISVWANFTGDNSNTWGNLFGTSSYYSFQFKKISTGIYSLIWWANGTSHLSSQFSLPVGWHHFTMSKNGNTELKFYIDGVLKNTIDPTDQDRDPTPFNYIGGDESGEYFNGKIDELGIWKRALSQSEITALYNNGTGLSYPFAANVPVTSVSVSPASVSLIIGASSTLTATVVPSNASIKTVSWKSSNSAIAIVNSTTGIITGTGIGTVTITATSQDGSKTATSTITVTGNSSLLTGIRSYYKFDEISGNAIDETGSNNGVVSAGVYRKSTGKVGSAYSFDSNSDYVSLSSVITQKTGSYSFWLNITAITDDLLIMGNDAYNSRIYIGSTNNLKLETNTNGQEYAFYTSFATSTWYHVVLTRQDDLVNFYRNGTYIGCSTISASNNLSISQLGFNGRSFKGTIDEVGIWSRALSSAEVSTLYNSGTGNSYPFNTIKSFDNSASQDDKELRPSFVNQTEPFIYPNPASDILYFKNMNSSQAEIIIYDMNGKTVIIKQIDENSIDISGLREGVYFVKYIDNEDVRINKFIKK